MGDYPFLHGLVLDFEGDKLALKEKRGKFFNLQKQQSYLKILKHSPCAKLCVSTENILTTEQTFKILLQ